MAAYTTIDNPELYFQVVKFVANASTQSITLPGSEDMQPDLVWGKSRSDAYDWELYDSVRGTLKRVKSNQDHQELSDAGNLTAFNSDGFSLGSATNMNYNSGSNIVAWCWKAGTTSGITTTGANITPSAYSFNATSGFSIIKYEGDGTDGTNVAHALGAVPHMIICKRLENANYWAVYHHKNTSAPNTDYLVLNTTAATGDAGIWKDTDPTSVYFRIDNSTSVNASGEDMLAYLFTSIQGFSKFGGWTGNGNADGMFVYTGFRPSMILMKVTDTTGDWRIFDTTRDTYNVADAIVYPSTNTAEGTETFADFLSNGFKIRSSSNSYNGSGNKYVYAAFAEQPFVNSNGVPCNAR